MFNVKEQEVRVDGLVVKLSAGPKTQRLVVTNRIGEVCTMVFDCMGDLLTVEQSGVSAGPVVSPS